MDPAKKQERFERKSREMNRRALGAVETLLAANDGSFAQISIDKLVAELGISRATLYSYYQDKNDVLRVLAEGLLHELVETAAGWLGRDDGLTLDELRDALAATMRVYVQHRTVLTAIVEVASGDDAMRARYEGMLQDADAALVRHIRLGQRRGFVDRELTARTTGTWITRMAWAGMRRFLADGAAPEVDRYADALARVIWSALYAPAQTAAG
jgi:AcrR family transcriptional regulator